MPKLQIFTVRGALLDTIPCSSAETVKELVKNAMESKKLRFEGARCLKQQEKDGTWTKIRWKDKVGNDDTVYRITMDPQKLTMKHRVRVINYEGEEIGLVPTKSGTIVRNIVNDVCKQLGIEWKHIYIVELIKDGMSCVAKMEHNLNRRDYLLVTVDTEERESVVLDKGEPILPKCLSGLTLKKLLLNFEHPRHTGGTSTTHHVDPVKLLQKLENGEPPDVSEIRLIAKCTVPPLQDHCLKRDCPFRAESRLYYGNLLKPYPQLQVVDFVSNNVHPGLMNDICRQRSWIINRKRRTVIQAMLKKKK